MIFRFLDFEVDCVNWRVLRDGQAVSVQPKVFELLAYLLRHRDRVVPKEELLGILWPDAVVSESSLTRAVSMARGVTGGTGEVIVNVPRRGYRICPDLAVEVVDGGVPATPVSPRTLDDSIFVGRDHILGELQRSWDVAREQRSCRFVWLSGAAGSGKTRTAARFAAAVADAAGTSAFAACPPGRPSLPLDMWSRLVCSTGNSHTVEPHLALFGLNALSAARDSRGSYRGAGRQSIVEGLQRWLTETTAASPALLRIDDVQWADAASLRILGSLAEEPPAACVLVILTVRDEALDVGHPAARLLSEMAARDNCSRLHLEALSVAEVERLFSGLTGWTPPPEIPAGLQAKTAGNPLFIIEILRNLHHQRSLLRPRALSIAKLKLPGNVRGVIAARVGQLPARCLELLRTAAFIGQRFEIDVLADVVSLSDEDVVASLLEARTGSVIAAEEQLCRFCHPLQHEVLYDSVPPEQAIDLHRRIAAALESAYASRRDEVVARLAMHYSELARDAVSASATLVDRAVDALHRCAELAAMRSAFDEAAEYYHDAFTLVDQLDPPANVDRRVDCLIHWARALGWAGDLDGGLGCAERAAAIASEKGKHDAVARASQAVLIPGGEAFAPQFHRALALLEKAELESRGMSTLERAGCLARLARQLYYLPNTMPRRLELCAEAERIMAASPEGDRPQIILDVNTAIWARASHAERSARLLRVIEMSEQHDPGLHLIAEAFPLQVQNLMELGDFAGAQRLMRKFRERISAHGGATFYETYPLFSSATLHLLRGELAQAEELINRMLVVNRRWNRLDILQYIGALFGHLRFVQGRTAEIAGLLQTTRTGLSYNSGWRAAGITTAVEAGQLEDARRELRTWAADGLPILQDDANATTAYYYLAYACSRLLESDVAADLFERLSPRARFNIVVFGGVACYGSAHLPLGWLAGAAGRHEVAVEHLQEAIRKNGEIGARPALARSHEALARQLTALGQHDLADHHRRQALDLAEAVGMLKLIQDCRGIQRA